MPHELLLFKMPKCTHTKTVACALDRLLSLLAHTKNASRAVTRIEKGRGPCHLSALFPLPRRHQRQDAAESDVA